MKSLITLLATFSLVGNTLAQNSVLEAYIEEGMKNNLALQQENLSLAQSMEALKQAKGMFMPDVSFQASYTLAGGGRNIAIPVGDLLNPAYATLNQLTDSRQFPTDLENIDEQFLPNRFHDTRVEIRQPIFNPEIYYNYKVQESLVSAQASKRDVYRQELRKEIKTGYYQYLTSIEVLEIYYSTEKLLKELLRVNQKLVENHKATIDAVYRAEFELSDLYSQIAEARRREVTARSYFNFLLNRDLNDSILVDKSFTESFVVDSPLEDLQQQALQRREELDQLQNAIQANEQLVALNKNRSIPKLSVGANLGYQGFDYTFDDQQDYYLMQFSMSFPLFTGFRNKSKTETSKIALNRLRVQRQELQQQIKFQVIDAQRQVAAARVSVRARQASLKSAKKSFDIISRKYRENQITLLDLLDARTKYTNAQLELVVAKYDLLTKDTLLERTTVLND